MSDQLDEKIFFYRFIIIIQIIEVFMINHNDSFFLQEYSLVWKIRGWKHYMMRFDPFWRYQLSGMLTMSLIHVKQSSPNWIKNAMIDHNNSYFLEGECEYLYHSTMYCWCFLSLFKWHKYQYKRFKWIEYIKRQEIQSITWHFLTGA
jgi:hypothetical protein